MSSARAARTSASGSSTGKTGRPGASRSTSRILPPRFFLSRRIASQATSRSTATGSGARTSSTTSVGCPESRSAARSPSATASPCRSSKPEAASSACANVWPRFENGAAAGLLERIGEAHGGLVGRAAAHHRLVVELPERLAGEEPGLDDLGHPGAALLGRERLEQLRVDHDAARVVERADEVLAGLEVDRRSCRRSLRRPDRRASSATRSSPTLACTSRRRSPRRRWSCRRRRRGACRRGRPRVSSQRRLTTSRRFAASPEGTAWVGQSSRRTDEAPGRARLRRAHRPSTLTPALGSMTVMPSAPSSTSLGFPWRRNPRTRRRGETGCRTGCGMRPRRGRAAGRRLACAPMHSRGRRGGGS